MEIITEGRTRIVILAGDFAFKIARLQIRYCIQRTVRIVWAHETRQKVEKWRSERGGVIRVVWQALTGGFGANLREYRLSRRYPDSGLAETLFTCGLVNVQRRGEQVAQADISSHPIVQAVSANSASEDLINDTTRSNQYCRINGHVRLVDYGNPILSDFLALRT